MHKLAVWTLETSTQSFDVSQCMLFLSSISRVYSTLEALSTLAMCHPGFQVFVVWELWVLLLLSRS